MTDTPQNIYYEIEESTALSFQQSDDIYKDIKNNIGDEYAKIYESISTSTKSFYDSQTCCETKTNDDSNEIICQDDFSDYEDETENTDFCLLDDNVLFDKTQQYSKYTIKELLLICEYYRIQKLIQQNKLKKTDIIEQVIWFESQEENRDIVEKRIFMWNTMTELKKDKILRKFIVGWKFN